jgi:hypothetical protein
MKHSPAFFAISVWITMIVFFLLLSGCASADTERGQADESRIEFIARKD